jgi:hypothetical protein
MRLTKQCPCAGRSIVSCETVEDLMNPLPLEVVRVGGFEFLQPKQWADEAANRVNALAPTSNWGRAMTLKSSDLEREDIREIARKFGPGGDRAPR